MGKTKFQELMEEVDPQKQESLFLLYKDLRDQLAEKLFNLDSELWGGFVFKWDELGSYRKWNYHRRAALSMAFMGHNEPEGFKEWEKNNEC